VTKEHRRAGRARLADEGQEFVLDQRVQAVRRLVQDQEIGVGEERQQQGDLATVPG
jgi:hypothetical protein